MSLYNVFDGRTMDRNTPLHRPNKAGLVAIAVDGEREHLVSAKTADGYQWQAVSAKEAERRLDAMLHPGR